MEDTFLLATIAAFLGGSVGIAAKIALVVFHPLTLIFIRFFFATLFLWPFMARSEKISLAAFKKFIPVGVVGALNPILLFIALQFTQVSVSPLIYAGVPAMTAFYFFILHGRKLNFRNSLGILIGFIGVCLIIALPLMQKQIDVSAMSGNALILLAAIAFMIYGLMSKHHSQHSQASPMVLTFYFSLTALFFSFPFAVFEIVKYGMPTGINLSQTFCAIYLGTFGTGVFYLVYQRALKLSSELAASLFLYLQPIATIGLAAVFLGERISLPLIFGGVLAIIGARLAGTKKMEKVAEVE